MKTTKAIAAAALAAAGLVHVYGAQEHITHMTVHGTFLLLLGIAQLGWTLLWLRWTTRAMALAGMMLSGGVVLLWLLLNGVEPPWPGHLPPRGIHFRRR